MANPQTENGYTRIANEIMDHIVRVKLSATQLDIVLAVWRYTYGFNRKEAELTDAFLAKTIGIARHNLNRDIKPLFENKILNVQRGTPDKKRSVISFNKNYDEWLVEYRTGIGIDTCQQVSRINSDTCQQTSGINSDTCQQVSIPIPVNQTTGIKSDTITGIKSDTITGIKSDTQEIQTIKKTIKKKDHARAREENIFKGRSFSPAVRSKIEEWLEYKAERKEYYQPRGLSNLLSQIENRLKEYPEMQIITLISDCMASCYKGIIWEKLPKLRAPKNGEYMEHVRRL